MLSQKGDIKSLLRGNTVAMQQEAVQDLLGHLPMMMDVVANTHGNIRNKCDCKESSVRIHNCFYLSALPLAGPICLV